MPSQAAAPAIIAALLRLVAAISSLSQRSAAIAAAGEAVAALSPLSQCLAAIAALTRRHGG